MAELETKTEEQKQKIAQEETSQEEISQEEIKPEESKEQESKAQLKKIKENPLTKAKVTNIDGLLAIYDLDREDILKRNEKYKDDFDRIDTYYEKYTQSPTAGLKNAIEKISKGYFDKIKKENEDLFAKSDTNFEQDVEIDDKKDKDKSDFIFYIQDGNYDAIDDLFSDKSNAEIKRLLTFDNYHAIKQAFKKQNELILNQLFVKANDVKIMDDVVEYNNGEFFTSIILLGNIEIIKLFTDILYNDTKLAKKIIKNDVYLQAAIESGNDEIIEAVESVYEKAGIKKKIADAKSVIKEDGFIKRVIDEINSGSVALDVAFVINLKEVFKIKVIETQREISDSKNNHYHIVAPDGMFKSLEKNHQKIYSNNGYSLIKIQTTGFERKFGLSRYEIMAAWTNLINIYSVSDIFAAMFITNIANVLMIDRDNADLRNEFRSRLDNCVKYPETNKISDRYYEITGSNLRSLQKSGFLDVEYCPTKLFYALVVLHAFPFPAYTHPFEFVSIDSPSKVMQFDIIKGEYGNESFFTDGDLLYLNIITPDIEPTKYQDAMIDVSRNTILNIKSSNGGDIQKKIAIINNFIPLFYTTPTSNLEIPSFAVKVLEVSNRKINWGAYEFSSDDANVFVNSYGLDNFLSLIKNKEPKMETYKGAISDSFFSDPKEGVIVSYNQEYVLARGLNKISFMSENYGKDWKKYYTQMFDKKHLVNEILNNCSPEFQKLIYTNHEDKVKETVPSISYIDKKEYKQDVKMEKIVKKQVFSTRDERIYLTENAAQKSLSKELIPVYIQVKDLTGIIRDEAILDELYKRKIDTILPKELLYLGFDLKQWAKSSTTVMFRNKYRLKIPNTLSFKYYLEKL